MLMNVDFCLQRIELITNVTSCIKWDKCCQTWWPKRVMGGVDCADVGRESTLRSPLHVKVVRGSGISPQVKVVKIPLFLVKVVTLWV